MPSRQVDPEQLRAAARAVLDAVREDQSPPPEELASAVRMSLSVLARIAPGKAVEVRIPPYGAIQCGQGPRHTRGQPPNTVETDPVTWVRLAAGDLLWADAVESGLLHASGIRADLSAHIPVIRP
ncbi:MAG: hypothetical protein GEU94_19200 [Micromonosporaceae bacterium]|nr:hypothetical protein [Micromonosporaceae bacterium]